MNKSKNISKKYTVILSMLIVLTGLITMTGFLAGQPDIDTRQGEKELEIMKSVISTSIAMTRKSLRVEESGDSRRGRYNRYEMDFDEDNIEGYYLHGQGVIFTIPYPCRSGRFPLDWDREIDVRLDEIMEGELVEKEFLEQEVEMLVTEVELQRQELGLSHSVPPPPPPPNAPESPASPVMSEQELASRKEAFAEAERNMQKTVAEVKVRLKEVREESAQQKEIAAAEREAIKEELINVIASHGSSLTQVKESEYINLILRDNCEFFNRGRNGDFRTVLSVRKSDLTAYRSGQLNLDQLKLKFIEY